MGVWIDTDMGFDDIAAILTVMHAGLQIDGVSLCFGNTTIDQVQANAASASVTFDWRFPIHTGSASPVLGQLETAQSILGSNGIPTLGASFASAPPLRFSRAFPALCQWLESEPAGPRRILALGPLTNIAALALARPDLAQTIDEIVWMGGGVTSGNHTASAEFNAFADPEALAIILANGLPLKMIDLDLCRKVQASADAAERVRACGGKNAELLADLLGGFIAIAVRQGRTSMALYDPVAAIAFSYPDLVRFADARIDAELSTGLTRGRTVVETRVHKAAPNAEYAVEIDGDTALSHILEALCAEASR
ncbi:nucleoside hydrolase [Limoniibacter endophyticus]|nr:nucleoside hydrolase [Limoniibacter endophyticus]